VSGIGPRALSMKADAAKILVSGVSVVDFVFQLDHFPDRGEKYRARDVATVGGGNAANAAVAAARLGGRVSLASRLGDDAVGDMILADIEREGVDCRLVKRFAGHRSPLSSIYVDGAGERQIVNFQDRDIPVDADWLTEQMPADLDATLADTRWGEGAIAAMRAARAMKIPGIIDAEAPIGDTEQAMQLATHVAFSAQGLRAYTGCGKLEDGLIAAAERLPGWLCVTDGENGVFIRENRATHHIGAFAVDPVDTLGAGDVWHGAFALRMGEGDREDDAVRFANAVAALKCTRFGGRRGTPGREETLAFLDDACPSGDRRRSDDTNGRP